METSDVTRKLLVENDRAVIARDPNNARNGVTCKGDGLGVSRLMHTMLHLEFRNPIFIAKSKAWRKEMTNILRQ